MKYADDTGFYCYRAIETLRNHCAALYDLSTHGKDTQWEKFREISGCDEQAIRKIKAASDPVRHGNILEITSSDRANLFFITWQIVDGYLRNLQINQENRGVP